MRCPSFSVINNFLHQSDFSKSSPWHWFNKIPTRFHLNSCFHNLEQSGGISGDPSSRRVWKAWAQLPAGLFLSFCWSAWPICIRQRTNHQNSFLLRIWNNSGKHVCTVESCTVVQGHMGTWCTALYSLALAKTMGCGSFGWNFPTWHSCVHSLH